MLRLVVALCLVGAAVSGPPVSRTRSEIEKFREFLESTRTENGVLVGEDFLNPDGNIWENSGKYQGDILLDDEQVESLVEQYAQGRNAYITPGTQWPGRTVVYEFAAGWTQAQRDHLLYSMRVLEDRTCIRFRHRNPGERNYVLMTRQNNGCYANVGFWNTRGAHTYNLANANPGQGCFNIIVAIHEWLHIIGFFHMQSTYTRDNYVRINWGNIQNGMAHNFDRYGNNMVSNLGVPYEYDSCMHYSAHAFSRNGQTTIDPTRQINVVMGQQSYVTAYDFLRVDRHYGCQRWRTIEEYRSYHEDQYEEEFKAFQAEQRAKEAAGEINAEEVVQEEVINDQFV